MILFCHENAHQHYFSSHPKLHRVVLYVKQTLEISFNICLSQSQTQPEEPCPNSNEPVMIDDMPDWSSLQVIAIQAASRLELAQQAAQDQQTQNL